MSIRTPLLVWLLLLILLALNIAAVTLPVSYIKTAVHLSLATLMAVLMGVFFMRLKEADGMLRLFAAGGVFWLFFLFLLTLLDVITR